MRTQHTEGYVPLWHEWVASVDVMPVRGFVDALMMRSQEALAFHAAGNLPPTKSSARMAPSSSSPCGSWLSSVLPLQPGVREHAFPLTAVASFVETLKSRDSAAEGAVHRKKQKPCKSAAWQR